MQNTNTSNLSTINNNTLKTNTNNFFGLPLSERLNKAGLSDRFYQAVKSGNASAMTSLLKQVDYSSTAADATTNTFLNDPSAFQP